MNQKGFTLVELLAVIVIISILGAIASAAVIHYISSSKSKAEEKFLDEISTEIESYIGLNSNEFIKGSQEYSFEKVIIRQDTDVIGSWEQVRTTTAWKMYFRTGEFTLQTLIDGLQMTEEFQNPNTGEVCLADKIKIEVYKDSDYVYYYCVNMSSAEIGCTASGNIDTRPDNLKSVVGNTEACQG